MPVYQKLSITETDMELTLTITASADALVKVLAALGSDATVTTTAAPVVEVPVAAPAPVAAVMPEITPAPVAAVMPEVIAAAPTIAGEPEFDSSGLAWDERIHSKQKGQTNDGKWRKQRGVDDNYYKQVEAELRARYSGSAPQAAPLTITAPEPVAAPIMPMPVVAPEPVAVPAIMGNAQPIQMPEAATPIMSVPPVVTELGAGAADNAANEPITFHTIMTFIGSAMGTGVVTPDYLVQLVAEINQQCSTTMNSFTDMAAFPQAVEYCWAALARDGKR
jgi:hypothetical protein